MNTRRDLFRALGLGLLVLPRGAWGAPVGQIHRVGCLAARKKPPSIEQDMIGALPQALRELGYVEGKNLVLEWRFAEEDRGRLPQLAAELVDKRVDVIVAIDGTPATLAAQAATKTIPIVFATAGDPVANHLVASLAHPGGNTTGVSLLSGTSVKQIEMLASMVPKLSVLGVVFNPTNPYAPVNLKELDDAARSVGMRVVPVRVQNDKGIDDGFAIMAAEHVGAFVVVRDSFTTQRRFQVAALAERQRLPGMAGLREAAEAGLLMSYGVSPVESYKRAAAYVDKILRGAKPADLPVEQPTKLELVLNKKTARALGLEFPPDLLVLADKVIE